jgi:hypothetical protein
MVPIVRRMKKKIRRMRLEALIKRLKMLFKVENSKEKLIIGCF